jgi:hypothetical protein
MDYAAARDAFFQPRDGAVAAPAGSPARALRDAIEPIAMVCYWGEPANAAYAGLGLDFLSGYVWGRASTLGHADAAVAAAAFGVFEPGLVADVHAAGCAAADLGRIRAAREAGSVAALEAALSGVDTAEVSAVVARLRAALDAGDVMGRPLFAGSRALPWPEHPLGALWHATTLLREYRGDGHLGACVAAGLSGLEANIVTELRVGFEPLSYTGTRGWSPEAMAAATAGLEQRGLVAGGALTAEGAALREEIEVATDRSVAPVVDALDPDLPALTATLDGWSQRVVDAGWFPPDPYKRAAG